ncbi:Gamma-glutamyltranspeptidase 1 [Cytospora mali]|uniref:Glutathione hydrolase n=1 Tax=Cytospora mali TaxID=578113 RepID=A0A194UNI3_CYTMA|nr:Gamma-glutamyltranspeptidase 1 [Valsa mali var. pyri (nom. inval.)]
MTTASPLSFGDIPQQTTLQGSHGAVASESSICSQIGIDLLKRGGNAADALVGTNLCVGVIGMYHSGIGGGGFALVRGADGSYETIDYREAAPAASFEDMFKGDLQSAVWGGLSVAVPGELRGLEYLHGKYGLLPWRAVVNPAVYLARNGFEVTEDLVRYMSFAVKGPRGNFLVEDPVWAEDFAPNGSLLQLGDTITRKRYANTLEKIGRHGADIFYKGEIAESIVKLVQSANGILTLSDMASYTALPKRPISISFRGFRLYSTGAPSSGSIMLSTLKTMEQYPQPDLADTNLTTHRFLEAMRFAYGARLELGDPAFVSDIEEFEEALLSLPKARDVRSRINDSSTLPVRDYDPGLLFPAESHGTSHIVAADASGMAISSTTTVNLLFGAQIMTPDSGVILNDEMDDFSIPGVRNSFGFAPSPANFIRPGKRPMSSITPIIAEHPNGTVFFITGAAGGSRIISSTTQTAWHLLEHGMNMTEAIAEPRVHDQLIPNQAEFEWSFDNGTIDAMVEKGHKQVWVRLGVSAVQGIQRLWDGRFLGVGEPRQRNSGGLSV